MMLQEGASRAVEEFKRGHFGNAESLARQVLARDPDNWVALNLLGALCSMSRRYDEAIASFKRALIKNKKSANLHFNLGNAYLSGNEPEAALRSFQRALQIQPVYPDAVSGKAIALRELGRLEEALASHRRAIALAPGNASMRYFYAQTLLLKGEMAEGWREYEQRWEGVEEFRKLKRMLPSPRWRGEDLTGRALFVYAEQGFGDTIQFVRYVLLAAERGAMVYFECQPPLYRLLQTMHPAVRVVRAGEALPAIDYHAPLLSLPAAFGTTLDTIPCRVPYLVADPGEAAKWQDRLGRDGYKVGFVWRGSVSDYDHKRSIALSLLMPLTAVAGVRAYSLQKDLPDDHPERGWYGRMGLVDVAADLGDFLDTAACMANLDLIISVDTAVAHLAGAMGKPVWLLNRCNSEWRWLLERKDSPWYPTMRIFRQQRVGDWSGMLEQVRDALNEAVAA